ncbi:hypothetical protein ABEB36_015191 [Hypothenemus hampei]|uniref:Retrotransposon gag domain-containing protein n=1 Tax=Hypothenemus hampei TaxID=57062 RepID=A0ABD1E1J8_HYPHA
MADALRSTITLLKTFDGTPSHLETFIHQIGGFRFSSNTPDLNSWHEIKTARRQKFSDPITRVNLQQQLIFLSKQKHESTQDYIQKLKALVTKINTKIWTKVNNLETRNILITQNELTATQNLLANITNELRTLLIV